MYYGSEIFSRETDKDVIPIVVVPPSYDAAQRYACIHFGAAQYLHSFHNPYENETNSENSMRNFLRIPCEKQKPLTIITMKGLSVCLEHRTVEVLGQPVELTGMEFDILSLLITNQRRVLTYGIILDLVWKEKLSKVKTTNLCRQKVKRPKMRLFTQMMLRHK